MQTPLNRLAGGAAALALCVSSTAAAAAAATGAPSARPVNPMVAVSLFGSQASAQTVCSQAAVAAGAAIAAQGQPGCVLPATDVPPPVGVAPPLLAPPPPPAAANFGVNWLLLALASLALLAGISTLFDDDDDDDRRVPVSPA